MSRGAPPLLSPGPRMDRAVVCCVTVGLTAATHGSEGATPAIRLAVRSCSQQREQVIECVLPSL